MKADVHDLSSEDLKSLVDFFALLYEWDCAKKSRPDTNPIQPDNRKKENND